MKKRRNYFIKTAAMNYRAVLVIALIAAVVGVSVAAVGVKERVAANSPAPTFTVVIDAGHGGIDGGVTGVNYGVVESELNLYMARALREDFENAGFCVVMTRTTSAGLYGASYSSLKKTDMLNRKKIIEQADADVVISLHMNKCSLPSRRGAQVFFKPQDDESRRLAERVQDRLNGMEEASRSCITLVGDYYVLNESPCPAILVECGFLSNAEDEKLLLTEEYREKLSYEIFCGTVGYLLVK